MDLQKEELNLGNLLNSITTPSPVLQVQLRKIYLKIVMLCGVIVLVAAAMPTLIPAAIVTIAKIVGVATGGATAHSYTAKQDSSTANTTTDVTEANNTAN